MTNPYNKLDDWVYENMDELGFVGVYFVYLLLLIAHCVLLFVIILGISAIL